jgi:hypothetical protein
VEFRHGGQSFLFKTANVNVTNMWRRKEMKMRKICISLITVMLVLGLSISTHAVLIDLGGGMIYSTDLDLTWLQDANYAQTSGFSPDGLMTWDEANTWATNLVYGGVGGWRLPTYDPILKGQCEFSGPISILNEMEYLRGYECNCTSNWANCPFINLNDTYWSGTTDPNDATKAWYWMSSCG